MKRKTEMKYRVLKMNARFLEAKKIESISQKQLIDAYMVILLKHFHYNPQNL
jgi:hypothetical protein